MKEIDIALAQARRLYHHYAQLEPPNRQWSSVAKDFGAIVETLEYLQHRYSSKDD